MFWFILAAIILLAWIAHEVRSSEVPDDGNSLEELLSIYMVGDDFPAYVRSGEWVFREGYGWVQRP